MMILQQKIAQKIRHDHDANDVFIQSWMGIKKPWH